MHRVAEHVAARAQVRVDRRAQGAGEAGGRDPSGALSVSEAGNTNLVVSYPDELVNDALAKMLRTNVGRLPVVNRHDPRQLAGYLGRATILRARLHRLDEEEVRESGWLRARTTR